MPRVALFSILLAAGVASAKAPVPVGEWRLSTLPLAGAQRYAGDFRVTVRRKGPGLALGIRGTMAGNDWVGTAELPSAGERDLGAVHVPVEIVLQLADKKTALAIPGWGDALRLLLELRFSGDEVTGWWGAGDGTEAWGALAGRRGGAATKLTLETALPCVTCCDLEFRCGGAGPGACNSSNTCRDACTERGAPRKRACLRELQSE